MPENNGVPANPGEGASVPQQTTPPAQPENAIPYARFKEVNDAKAKLERELFEANQKLTAQTPAPARNLDAKEFAKLLHQGYSEEDITFVETVMKSTNTSANEVIELPHVKKALAATKAERQSQSATPVPSQPVSFSGVGRANVPFTQPHFGFEKGMSSNANPVPQEQKLSFQEWKAKRRGGK